MRRTPLFHAVRSCPYRTLGLSSSTDYTEADIKKAYKARAAKLHPDAGGDSEAFTQLQDAYKTLLRGKNSPADISSDTDTKSGFYDSVHAQWSADAGNYRRYHAKRQHGEGLGYEFSTSAGWDGAKGGWANESTRDFYRPYSSDFDSPFSHGFTEEEVRDAERKRIKIMRNAIAKYAAMLCGVVMVVYMYCTHDRIGRANSAKLAGYKDPAYWEAVDADKKRFPQLRQEDHWLYEPIGEEKKDSDDGETEKPKPRRGLLRGRPGGVSGAPTVLNFRGRPFTPSGVRRPKANLPKTASDMQKDVSIEMEDDDEDY